MLPELRFAAHAPRIATKADTATVTRVLVDAFRDDPMWGSWAFPKRMSRRANRASVFRAFVVGALRYPTTWLAPHDTAVAMWIPPGGTGLTTAQEVELGAELRARLGPPEAERILHGLELFARRTPTEPHYYLSLLGTDPAHTGRGYGQALLGHTLSIVDEQRAAAYLDCADNLVPMYQQFGFRVVSTLVLPDGGPRSNGMWRAPAIG